MWNLLVVLVVFVCALSLQFQLESGNGNGGTEEWCFAAGFMLFLYMSTAVGCYCLMDAMVFSSH